MSTRPHDSAQTCLPPAISNTAFPESLVYAIFNQGDATLSLAQRAIDPASTSSLARTPFLSTSNAKINRRPMEGRGGEMAWTDKLAGAGGQPHL